MSNSCEEGYQEKPNRFEEEQQEIIYEVIKVFFLFIKYKVRKKKRVKVQHLLRIQ